MRLQIRSKVNYVLEISSQESLVNLKAKLAEIEKSEDFGLYVSGKPLDFETGGLTVESLKNSTLDVVVLLRGGKVSCELNCC